MDNELRDKIAHECALKIGNSKAGCADWEAMIAIAMDEYAEGLRKRAVQLETLLATVRQSLRERAKDGGENNE